MLLSKRSIELNAQHPLTRWLRRFALALPLCLLVSSVAEATEPELNEAERAWLRAHPHIRLGVDPVWPPFEFIEQDGSYRGIGADYVALLSQKLDIALEPVANLNWENVIKQAKTQQLDMLPALMATEARREFLLFTRPYLDFPMVIVRRQDAPFTPSLDVLAGQRVAVINAYVSHEYLKTRHAELDLVPLPSIHAALVALSMGEVEAFVGNIASVSYAINQLGLSNLSVVAYTPYSFKLAIGVRKDWPELVTILQKALDSISEDEHKAIRRSWFQAEEPREEQAKRNLQKVLLIGFGLLSLFIFALFIVILWNQRLQREIRQRAKAETALREAESKLLNERKTLQLILDNAPLGIWLQNRMGRLLFVNQAFCNAVGISEQKFLSVPHYAELYPEEIARSCISSDEQALAQAGPHISYEKIMFTDGQIHELEIIKARLLNESGEVDGLIGLSMDISARRKAERELEQRAFFDELTGLPNRNLLLEQLKNALAVARSHHHYGALLFFDLDNFKVINDSLGHLVGDRLLYEISKRLTAYVREEDVTARLGGDEFVVILQELGDDGVSAVEQAQNFAEELQAVISQPYPIGNQSYHITPSIGIAIYPIGQENANDVLKYADTAMYRAKEEGRNLIRFFLPKMQQAAEARLTMQNALRTALTKKEFELYFQPQINFHGNLIGAEVLLRWRHPERGMISPADFIPLAEDSGMIVPIGEWVLRKSCEQFQQWREQGIMLEKISVNLSPRQFHQAHFVPLVKSIIEESGIAPEHLELEVTERILIHDSQAVQMKMQQLKEFGVSFAIDDFGTGYSSLSYLKGLPLNRLKIDKSFVSDITVDVNDAVIVETIIGMANNLGLELIAEGVENKDELCFLHIKGCHNYQGYYFSRPLACKEFVSRLSQGFDENLKCMSHE